MPPMPSQQALIVLAATLDDHRHRSAAAAAVEALAPRYRVEVIDLLASGFVPAMSSAERRAYHDAEPILDPEVRRHAGLIVKSTVVVFVYPTAWWSPPPVLKAWLERVLVPGVGFVFDERNRVRPNLRDLRAIVGVTSYRQPRPLRRWGGDGGRHMLHRALRLNVPHRVRRLWITGDPLADRVHSELEQL